MQQLKITPSVTVRTPTVTQYLADISHYARVTPEEEAELAARIQAGDEDALKRLVEANLRFVVSVAKQYQGRGLELSDLISDGNLGLMKAAERFDPTKGFKFISYAVWWIRQSILQGISESARMVRLPLNQINAINKLLKCKSEFIQDNEREPTEAELAELADISAEKMDLAMRSSGTHVSLDMPIGDDGESVLMDVVHDESTPDTDSNLLLESCRADIESVMQILPERERMVVGMFFGLGRPERSLDEIAEEMDLSRERVRQLKEKAIRKLSRPMVKDKLKQYLSKVA